MNRRRIRRQVQNSKRTFWGSRAYITIRFPASLVPPKPNMDEFRVYGEEDDSFGLAWTRKTSTGTAIASVSKDVSSGGYPCNDDPRHGTIFRFRASENPYHPGEMHYGWSEFRHFWIPDEDKPTWCKRLWFHAPAAHAQKLEAVFEWEVQAGRGFNFDRESDVAAVRVLTHYWAAKTHYVTVTDRYYDFTYSVKPWYAKSFAKDMNRILNELDRLVKAGKIPPYKVMRHG